MTNFTRVSEMNTAFGNPKGNPKDIDFNRVRSQCMNIADEFGELMVALGADPSAMKYAVTNLKAIASMARMEGPVDLEGVRDALCDINVFSYGAHHLMGIDADADMEAVIDGVMTRFIKDEEDKEATIEMHQAKGVTSYAIEGNYPTKIMRSSMDQPDAPKGKFLKSASYQNTVFPPI
jgi:predicted HAD superfamily Cof-like phosphohydrolase